MGSSCAHYQNKLETKKIFDDSLGENPWGKLNRSKNFEKTIKKQYLETLWESPIDKIKKTSRKPKNKKKTKLFRECLVWGSCLFFLVLPSFFLCFFGLDLEKTKKTQGFLFFWIKWWLKNCEKQKKTNVFFLFLGVCGFCFFLAAQWKTKKNLEFGTGETWADVEADEATFDKKIVRGKLHWEQWCGIVQRGKPQTLVLHRLKPLASKLRAPGPGAVRKVEWKPLAAKWLKDRQVILHTDSAKSYASKISGVLHDRVVHKKKRVKVNGKFKWVAPTYVKIQKHKIPGTKKTLRVKSGTQIVDRCWRYLKERLNINQHAKVGSRLLRI